MFQARKRSNRVRGAGNVLELIYHNTVRSVRKSHSNAVMAILMNMIQAVIFVMSFYLLFIVLGMRGAALRGDFLLYIMSGIFLYLLHTRTIQAVYSSEGPGSAMMKHAPMTTAVTISAAAISSLYIQLLTMIVIIYVYHVGWGPITIHNWSGALGMVLVAWFSGLAIGLVFLALKPWYPTASQSIMMIYTRASMIASGKMFVANSLPSRMVDWFDWNPLFHIIDQCRGFLFINYFPHYTDPLYPLYVSAAILMIGLMAEFYTRRNVSVSWGARQ